MFTGYLREIEEVLSGEACMDNLIAISRFHRVKASEDYRRAAEICYRRLTGWGLDAQVVEYSADGQSAHWTSTPPLEWEVTDAQLWLEEPAEHRRCLASLRDTRVSLFERSGGTPPGGIRTELVVLEDGSALSEADVDGKFVLGGSEVESRWMQLRERGAVGVVCDQMNDIPGVRYSTDLPRARHRGRFRHAPGDPKFIGFTVTPTEGQRLRRLARDLKNAEGEDARLVVHADADVDFRVGSIQNVSALIPGTTAEEILVTAHLCHPAGMAADNASGAGTVMEMARTLQSLVDQGRLETPRRSIRFLLIPEMMGTYAHLATNEECIPDIVAGVNLDMVGQNQALCEGPLLLVAPPRATSCCFMELLERILLATGGEAGPPSGSARFPLFQHRVTPFSGGSDHYILSDPTVGVPTSMLIQWPDRFYHTTADSIDKMDAAMLKRVGVLGATHAYFMANAGFEEAVWLAGQVAEGFCRMISRSIQDEVASLLQQVQAGSRCGWSLQQLRDRCEFELERKKEDLSATSRLCAPGQRGALEDFIDELQAELEERVHGEVQVAARELEIILQEEETPADGPFVGAGREMIDEARAMVPRRVHRGPIDGTFLHERLQVLEDDRREAYSRLAKRPGRDAPAAKHLFTVIGYWMDGERSAYEVARSTGMETGFFDLAFVLDYIKLLADMDLVVLSDPGSSGRND